MILQDWYNYYSNNWSTAFANAKIITTNSTTNPAVIASINISGITGYNVQKNAKFFAEYVINNSRISSRISSDDFCICKCSRPII